MIHSQTITEQYALYNGDCVKVLPTLPAASIGASIYSPPFGIQNLVYSSSDEDLSNCLNFEQFLEHYEFVVKEIHRVTKPGRLSGVHCMDIPAENGRGQTDLPGKLIALHQRIGFDYVGRHCIWKEPLRVAIRTRSKHLMHKQLVKDSTHSSVAGADYLLIFRREGENKEPVAHPTGLSKYAGERELPEGLAEKYRNWTDPKTNKLSHWIWQQYASSFWDDIRINRVLPYKAAKDQHDEKHIHPLQLDVIERFLTLYSNLNDVVLTPFLGVGSEAYAAVAMGRKACGIEMKSSYYRQAVRNVAAALLVKPEDQQSLEFEATEELSKEELAEAE